MQSTTGRILIASLALGSVTCFMPRPAYAGPRLEMDDDAWVKLNYEVQGDGGWRNTGSGPGGTGATTDMFFRRSRLTLLGQMTERVGFFASVQYRGDTRIQGLAVTEQPGSEFGVLDAFVTGDLHPAWKMRAGLTKDQLVREHNEGCFFPLSADRSLFVYPAVPRGSRDFGVVAWGNLLGDRVQYRLAAMNGNDSSADPKSSLRYTGRLHVSLFEPESSLVYAGTYLGEKRVLTLGAGYQIEPNAVYGNVAAQTLAKGVAGPEHSQEMLDRIVERAKDLARLVERFELTVDAGLTELVDVAGLTRQLAAERERISVTAPPALPTVSLNPVAARRILDELLDNALRFSPEGSPVAISVSFGPVCLEVRVADHGPGIDPADRDRIFAAFEQLEDLNRRVHQGAGLGLSLARTAARAMGGDVVLERSGPEGSTFLWTIALEG